MISAASFLAKCVRDLILAGLICGIAGALWRGEGMGASILAGALWGALNLTLLSWLLGAMISPSRSGRLFIFILACAKIPASYCVLFWLYQVEYLDAVGLTIGLVCVMPVLVFRGIREGPHFIQEQR